MEIAAIVIAACLLNLIGNLACFTAGARIRQKTDKGEEIRIPEVNPMKTYREHKDRKEAEKENHRLDIIMQNIERYDGTECGQQDIPG